MSMLIDDKVFNKIKELTAGTKIIFILLGGSRSWKSNLYHDTDLNIVTEGEFYQHYQNMGAKIGPVDLFIHTYDMWKTKNGLAWPLIELSKLYPENLLYGEIPDDTFDPYEVLYKQYEYGLNGYLRNERKGYCLKGVCWGLIIYYAVLNNGSFDFTPEQREIIQKCHDGELPISYRDELKANMEAILREKGLIN